MRTAIFFAINNKLRHAESIEENELKVVFLIDNLMDYLMGINICVNIDFFRATWQKVPENITIHMPQRTSNILLVLCGMCIVMKK